MNNLARRFWAAGSTLLLLASGVARDSVELGTPFRDGAVLQRNKPVLVWGMADPGERVTVEYRGPESRAAEAVADQSGSWRVKLGAMTATAEPGRLIVRGRNEVAIGNVVVGEVWLCSGQSNMYAPVRASRDAAAEIRSANDPLLREFAPKAVAPKGEKNNFDALIRSLLADQPRAQFDGKWEASSPQTVGEFTAIGYFFARELRRSLPGVPVGIIKATLGGSPIEGWMSGEALGSDPAFAVVAERWRGMKAKVKEPQEQRSQPSALYNGVIHPLVPIALAGFLWDQGAANATRPREYPRLFAALIHQWRSDFAQPDLPFIFVQMAGFAGALAGPGGGTGRRWAWQREAQASALVLPHVGMAVAIDIGDPVEVHFPNKQEAGRRAALVARAKVYGQNIEDTGPTYVGFSREGSALRIRFAHAAGLHAGGDASQVFTIAGADQRFVPARLRIEGTSVVVFAESIETPVAARCEWCNYPGGWLANGAGLPAAPFRTDEWSFEVR